MMILSLLLAVLAAPPSEERFDAFFSDFVAKREGIRLLDAKFIQTNTTPEETRSTHGTLLYAKPRRLIFRYADPERVYLIDGQRIYEYDAEIEQVQSYDLGDDPKTEALFLGFDDDTERLREAYDITFLETEREGDDVTALELIPKATDSAPYFQSIRIYMRGKSYLPYRIRLKTDTESEILFEVGSYEINGPLDKAKTQIHLPEGTLIVQDDAEPGETVGPGGKDIPTSPTPSKGPAIQPAEKDTHNPESQP